MHLIVGLGNPGAAYARHRHNIGFQVAELLASRHGWSFDRTQGKAKVAAGQLGGVKVLLAKPQTFMNDSGVAVRALMDFYKVPLANLIVVADDLDLPLAQLRLRPQGSAGGQNGVKSIIQHLGTPEWARLRVGIGRPPGRMDPAAYVLQPFTPEQEADIAIARQEAADALEMWLRDGLAAAMNRYNGARSE